MAGNHRETILNRIRKNLAVPGISKRGHEQGASMFEVQSSAQRGTDVGRTLLDTFEEELTLLGGNLRKVNSKEELITSLRDICQKENFRNIVLSREPFLQELGLEERLRILLSETALSKATGEDLISQLKSADVGVTACELLAAETGTIILRSSPVAPRALSLLPRAHVVIAREEQLFPTVAACFERLHRGGDKLLSSSCITLVSGPSRTADIEKVLVKGVHGPKDLYVFLMAKSK